MISPLAVQSASPRGLIRCNSGTNGKVRMGEGGLIMKPTTRKIVLTGMLSAIAFVFSLLDFHIIPGMEFLSYDPTDIPIMFTGLLFGPVYAFFSALIVPVLKFVLGMSHTGPFGVIMKVIASSSYCIPAAIIYDRTKTRKAALIGLAIGCVCMTVIMIPTNYFITPLYLGCKSEDIVPMLPPLALFNLAKSVFNSIVIFFSYKPVVTALRKSKLLDERS